VQGERTRCTEDHGHDLFSVQVEPSDSNQSYSPKQQKFDKSCSAQREHPVVPRNFKGVVVWDTHRSQSLSSFPIIRSPMKTKTAAKVCKYGWTFKLGIHGLAALESQDMSVRKETTAPAPLSNSTMPIPLQFGKTALRTAKGTAGALSFADSHPDEVLDRDEVASIHFQPCSRRYIRRLAKH
jgi:hypothetical protein